MRFLRHSHQGLHLVVEDDPKEDYILLRSSGEEGSRHNRQYLGQFEEVDIVENIEDVIQFFASERLQKALFHLLLQPWSIETTHLLKFRMIDYLKDKVCWGKLSMLKNGNM